MELKRQKENFRGSLVPKTLDKENRTIDVTWSMGGRVRRRDSEYGIYYEEISLEPEHVRIQRLQNGAPFLNNHNDKNLSDQIGVVERAWIEDGVGGATIKFSSREDVAPIYKDVCDGIYRNISVGYKPYKALEIEQENDYPILRSIDTEFFEISLVPINAEASAQVRGNKNDFCTKIIRKEKDEMEKRKEIEVSKAGLKEKAPLEDSKNTPPETAVLEKRYEHHQGSKEANILAQERARIKAIETRCEAHGVSQDLKRRLIDDGASESEASERILSELSKRSLDNMVKNQGTMPKIEAGDFDEITTRRDAVKNGLLFSYDQSLVRSEHLNENVKTYARKSIPQIISMELGSQHLSDEEIVRRSFHSTSDFPLVMGLAGETAVKESYLKLVKKQTFRPLVRYESPSNFLPMRKMQMGEMPTLEKIPEGAEVTYGTISENAEQWAIGKYGKAFSATYEMMVNDQKNLIFGGMTQYGAAAANLESNLAWGVFKKNPMVYKLNADGVNVSTNKWFCSDHKNESEPSALTHEAIEEAEYMMSVQKGNDEREGDELNIVPRFLIVPSRLKNTAKRLIYSQFNPTQVQDVNIYQNEFDVISEARLNPKQGEPYNWFLTCDPDVLPVIWMAYLNGERSPRTMYQTDFNTLSIKIRADLNFGVTHGEWRGVHRNQGVVIDKQREANNFVVPTGGRARR